MQDPSRSPKAGVMSRVRTAALHLKNHRPVVGSFLWSFSGGFVSRGAVLVTTLVAARALEPVVFGRYVAMLAITILAASFWDFGLSVVLTREYAADRISTPKAIRQSAMFRLRTWPLWLVSFGAGMIVLRGDGRVPVAAMLAFAGDSLLIGVQTPTLAMLRAKLRFRWSETAVAGGRWLTAIISLAALPSIGTVDGILFFALALIAGDSLTLILGILAVRRIPRAPTTGDSAGAGVVTVRAAAPFAANGLLATAYNRLDVLIVAGLASVEQLALYAPASRIQDALYMLPGSFAAVALPMMSKAWAKPNGREEVARLVRLFITAGLAIAVPVACIFFFFTPEILRVILGSVYVDATIPTRILVWFLPLAAIGAPLLAALAATGHGKDTTKVFAVSFVAAMVGHLSLDWQWGATGGAIASLLRDPAAIIVAMVLARRVGLLQLRTRKGVAQVATGLRSIAR